MAACDRVIILGMRRSGTSLTAKFLADRGYFFENDSRPADRSNPEGYWESKKIQDLNSSLVRQLGGSADAAPRARRGWESKRPFTKEKNEIQSILTAYDGHTPWGMKDDRFSITLPLWKPALPPGVAYVICIRNPMSVVKSWRAMTMRPINVRAAYEAWYSFVSQAVLNTQGERRLLVSFENFGGAPKEQAERLCGFLGVEFRPGMESAFKVELAHHQASAKEFLDAELAPSNAKLLYLALVACVSGAMHLDDIGKSLDEEPGTGRFGGGATGLFRRRS